MENSDSLAVIYTDQEQPIEPKKSSAAKLEKFVAAQNICDLLDDEDIQQIYQDCMLEYDQAESMMRGKITDWKKDIELVSMISTRDKPFDGASDVVYPLASNAVMNLASKAYNAFFPDDDVYKGKVEGEDNGVAETVDGEAVINPETKQPIMVDVGQKAKIAERVALSMNYQIRHLIPNWKADTIQLFYGALTLGTMYREEGYDELKQRNYSRLLFPDKVIVNKNISCLEDSVYSVIRNLKKNDIQANINKELFVEYDYVASVPMNESVNLTIKTDTVNVVPQQKEEAEYLFVEQHTWLDLDEDGFKEPYCVTFDKGNQKIVRIYADYDIDDISVSEDGYIYNIERKVNITDFRPIPSFDGSFWGLGLPFFLTNINSSVNTSINMLIDSMNRKIMGGGYMANDLNVRSGGMTFKMGEYKKIISLSGGAIADKFFTLPLPEPSPVMLALLERMIAAGEKIGLVTDALTGNITSNMAPTTYLGLVDNAVAIENSIFKLLNESFLKEIKVRKRINAEYFNRDLYHEITITTDAEVDPSTDFLSDDIEIVLLTDTSNITKSQKLAKAQIYDSLMQDPYYDGMELRKMKNEAIGMPELNKILRVPQPTPQADMLFAQAENKKADAKLADVQTQRIKAAAEIEEKGDKANLMIADIELKRSQATKNIADSFATLDKASLDKVKTYIDSLHKEKDLNIRQQQNDSKQSESTSNS